MPAYLGVLGGGLTAAANAYMRTVLDEPYEKIRRRKAEVELENLEAQASERRANAAWLARRTQPGYQPYRIVTDKLGNAWRVSVDPADTSEPTLLIAAPDIPAKLKEIREGAAHRAMERIIGRKRGLTTPVPYNDFTPEELRDPELIPYLEQLGQGRSQFIVQPGGLGADVRTKDDILRGGTGGGTAAPDATGQLPPTQGTPSAKPPPARPGGDAGPPAGRKGEAGASKPVPEALKEDFRGMSDDDLETTIANLTEQDRKTPSAWYKRQISAAIEVLGERRTKPSGEPPEQPPAPPAGTKAPAAPGSTAQPPRTQLPPTPRPPAPPTVGATRTTPLNLEQQEAQARKRWEDQLKYEEAERQRLGAERQAAAAERQRLIDLGGTPTNEQHVTANRLYSENLILSPHYSELDPKEKEIVNAHIRAPKLRKESEDWLKLARPHMDELDALQVTQDLVSDILPLIKSGNLGFMGETQAWRLWVKQFFPSYRNEFETKAEAQLRAQEGLLGKIDQARLNAQVASMVETNDEVVRDSMRSIAARARLQTLSSVLVYAHALAQKRLTGGTQRGIIKSDMEAAEKLFNPTLFFTSPEQLMANLQELQTVINRARGNVVKKIRTFHVNPETGEYIPATAGVANPAPSDEASEMQKIRDIVSPKGKP